MPDYRVIALEPHPAGQDESVTHPHVRDETLCEGDGQGAVRSAPRRGAGTDFFTVVHRVLQTYAAGRAFIDLDDWEGTRCSDCGCGVAESDSCICYHCDATLCCDCRNYCSQCDEGRSASVSEQLQRLSGGLLQQLLGDLSRLQTPPLPCLSRRKALQCVP